MDNPVSVASIKGTIPSPNANACERFTKALIQFPTLIYQFYSWAVTALGHFSVDFKRDSNFTMVGDYIFSASSANEITGPGGRLLCNGQEVDILDYPELSVIIAGLYGTPTSATKFKLPDFGGRFPVGVGDGGGALGGPYAIADTGGDDEVVLDATMIPAHTHGPGTGASNFYGAGAGALNVGGGSDTIAFAATGSTGGGLAHENRPPFMGVYVYVQA